MTIGSDLRALKTCSARAIQGKAEREQEDIPRSHNYRACNLQVASSVVREAMRERYTDSDSVACCEMRCTGNMIAEDCVIQITTFPL